ncbi:MAG: TIGR04282 family arsenosugar biosynthesis glycosyltransferase [Pelovirga sp.]
MEKVENSPLGLKKKRILGIFAKEPVPGRVKTRLSPPLSAVQAADIYLASLRETVQRMQTLTDCDLAICYSGDRDWFAETFPGLALEPQYGDDLGARMAHSLSRWLAAGYDAAVLIGSDAPDLPTERIEQAFSALEGADLVHGPAVDGGYYLVGESSHYDQLFSGIAWSTGSVLEQTLATATTLGLSSVLLQPWEDLDDLPALLRLVDRSPHSVTAKQVGTVLKHSRDSGFLGLT